MTAADRSSSPLGAASSPAPLAGLLDALASATAAPKCHPCGCLHDTVASLEIPALAGALGDALAAARRSFAPVAYDCLGCPECWPAVAANLAAEAFPGVATGLVACPTAPVEERAGWPPLPGDYRVVRTRAPVAVCTLGDDALAERIAARAPEGLAIVGTLRTENLGIERIVRNVIANPWLRVLVLCGAEPMQAVGHLPGQSLASLWREGVGDDGRILGARGRRPVLVNVRREDVDAFRRQVDLVAHVGLKDDATIAAIIAECAASAPGPAEGAPRGAVGVPVVRAEAPRRLVQDAAGYVVVYVDRARRLLVVEHYTTAGVLDVVVEGETPAAVAAEVVARGLVARLDHAAYLGRELARAERCLDTGERYVQDRAPGEVDAPEPPRGCGCAGGCGTGATR